MYYNKCSLFGKMYFFKNWLKGCLGKGWVFGEESLKTTDLSQLCSGILISVSGAITLGSWGSPPRQPWLGLKPGSPTASQCDPDIFAHPS